MVISGSYLNFVCNALHVTADFPEDAAIDAKSITVESLRKFLAEKDIHRSDHWIEFALRSIPLNIGEAIK